MQKFFLILILLHGFFTSLHSQVIPEFGKVSLEDLSNNQYRPDPGADAIILSDVGIITVNYMDGFYIELVRDVKIKIINSQGFDYADIQIPYLVNDELTSYRASAFNLRNGEKAETPVSKKSFIREESTKYRNILKFSFPDVHEGTVIEYTYKQKRKEGLNSLFPWAFQTSIPIVHTSISAVYPKFFAYKTIISGNPNLVVANSTYRKEYFGGLQTEIRTYNWRADNVPAFHEEPLIKSLRENQTRLSFELASVDFPNSSFEEISPTYETLTKKLLERDDFGKVISNATFLKAQALKITAGISSDLEKVRAVHKYLSEKIMWDGEEDFLSSSSNLKKIYKKEKGNNADINMMLIAMLRSISIKADPVILSTRSNGSINQFSAMMQQFNYLVANVTVNDKSYLVDATDPLRPFDMLPFECLNGIGRLINNEYRFVDLKNSEIAGNYFNLDLSLSNDGSFVGNMKKRSRGYPALVEREKIKLEGVDGYSEIIMELFSEGEINNYVIHNVTAPDSDIVETCKLKIDEGAIRSGDNLVFNPYFSFARHENPFISPERKYPVDFGCAKIDEFSVSIQIPDNFSVISVPENVNFILGKNDGKYQFTSSVQGNKIILSSSLIITKTAFSTSEYSALRDFFVKVLQSQDRLIELKKNNA